jgi:hypothetical protein
MQHRCGPSKANSFVLFIYIICMCQIGNHIYTFGFIEIIIQYNYNLNLFVHLIYCLFVIFIKLANKIASYFWQALAAPTPIESYVERIRTSILVYHMRALLFMRILFDHDRVDPQPTRSFNESLSKSNQIDPKWAVQLLCVRTILFCSVYYHPVRDRVFIWCAIYLFEQ